MSEPTETVVVADANAAHKLIGRSIGGRIVATYWAGRDTLRFCALDGATIGRFIRWGSEVEVDALPPAIMRVQWWTCEGSEVIAPNRVRCRVDELRVMHGKPQGRGEGITAWGDLPIDDDGMVEVLAPVPVMEAADEVTVREAAEWLVAIYSPLDFTEPRIAEAWAGLVAALAADRGEA